MQKCLKTGKTTKSVEYGKCLKTWETTKSLDGNSINWNMAKMAIMPSDYLQQIYRQVSLKRT